MYRRTRAREVALQLLFQRDLNPGIDRPAVERFINERLRDAASAAYCTKLYDGVVERAEELDGLLTVAADNWRIARMAGTDRNVMRLAALEILWNDPEAPAPVVLNEAVELARRFGTANSASFVNGVLDKVYQSSTGGETPAS